MTTKKELRDALQWVCDETFEARRPGQLDAYIAAHALLARPARVVGYTALPFSGQDERDALREELEDAINETRGPNDDAETARTALALLNWAESQQAVKGPAHPGPWALARRQRDARGPIKERLWWKFDGGPFENGHFDPRKDQRHIFRTRREVELARHDYGGFIVRVRGEKP